MIKFYEDELPSFSQISSFYNSACLSVNPSWDFNSFVYIASTSVELSIKSILRLLSGRVPNSHESADILGGLIECLHFLGFEDEASLLQGLLSDSVYSLCILVNHSSVRYSFSSISTEADIYTESSFDYVLSTFSSVMRSLVSKFESKGYKVSNSGVVMGLNLFNDELEFAPPKVLRGRHQLLQSRGFDVDRMIEISREYYASKQKGKSNLLFKSK